LKNKGVKHAQGSLIGHLAFQESFDILQQETKLQLHKFFPEFFFMFQMNPWTFLTIKNLFIIVCPLC